MKYNQWLSEWLENYVKPVSKQKTYARYADIIEKHILGDLGGYDLDGLTPLVLQHFTIQLLSSGNLRTGGGLSANTVNCIVTVVQNSLRSAYAVGQVAEYNAGKIRRPKIKEGSLNCFTVKEQKKIEKEVLSNPKPRLFGIVLSLYTGMRLGEILALEWEDVDFVKGTISVNKSCHDGMSADGKFIRITELPKTPSSKRVIPLPKQLLPYLKMQKKKSKSQYVIESTKNIPIAIRAYQRSFEICLKKLNIPHKGFHALRHTFATRAIECGMDVKTLSEIMGHKNATITLNKYVHSFMDHKKEMMNRIGKML